MCPAGIGLLTGAARQRKVRSVTAALWPVH